MLSEIHISPALLMHYWNAHKHPGLTQSNWVGPNDFRDHIIVADQS